MAAREQLVRHLGMARRPLELEDRRLVAAQAQPFQPVEYGGDRLFRGAGPVGILDPQQEPAAMMAREQPVEKRGARPADVDRKSVVEGKRGSESVDTGGRRIIKKKKT